MIHLPQPCPVKWDSMTPTDGGRDCSVCKKVIPDFTGKTESEILEAFKAGVTCGSFSADQVSDGSTYDGWKNYFNWKTGITLLLAGSIFLVSCRRRTSGMYKPHYHKVRIEKNDSARVKRHVRTKFFKESSVQGNEVSSGESDMREKE